MRLIILFSLIILSPLSLAAKNVSGPAPDFTLKATTDSNLRLSEQRGQVVLINFWASWCGPCRQEMPLLEEMQKKYSKLGFTVLGVNVDKDINKADKILKDIPVSFPVLYDNEGVVSKLFDVSAMPTTVIVDRDGNMRYLHMGFKPGYEDLYVQNIKTLIRE
jgi:thiol-disulfide isomerase/thioredoxin